MGKLKDMFFYPKGQSPNAGAMNYMDILSGATPIFSQFGQDIYASDVVQQAIGRIVSEMMKLEPRHVRNYGNGDVEPVADNIQNVLDAPNELMTTAEFIGKVVWNLMLNCNAFIYPTYLETVPGKWKLTGLYPINPSQVDFLEDPTGKIYVKLYFNAGYNVTLPYSRLCHIKHNYSVNDVMGGNEQGQRDNGPLLKALALNDVLLEGVRKAMKTSFAINGVIKYPTLIGGEAMAAHIQEFEEKLARSESGILPLDIKGEYIPMTRDLMLVDEPTLRFIDDKILRNFGVPVEIVRGSASKEIQEAFYQTTLETLVINLGQNFTKFLFTQNQKAFGHKIIFYQKELIYMTTQQKIEMIAQLAPTGAIYENEKRVAFGYAPSPELVGRRMVSLNWVDSEYAKEYQTGVAQKEKEEPDDGAEDE